MSATKRKDAHANSPTRPLMPRLAASAQNAKASPAPKLAGYNSTPPLKRQTTAQSTPTLSSTRTVEEQKATPVKNFVNANVTPRSSSRRSRAGSSQSTPGHEDDTPSRTRPISTPALDTSTLKIAPNGTLRSDPDVSIANKRFTQLQGMHQSLPSTPNPARSPDVISDAHAVSKQGHFFYAHERPSAENYRPRPQHKKTPSFVYANGTTENGDLDKVSGSAEGPRAQKQTQSGASVKAPLLPGSTQQSRQPSPPRQGFHLTYRKGASQIIPPQSQPSSAAESDITKRRQSSIDDDAGKRQSRAFSVSSIGSSDQPPSRKEPGFPFLSMFSLPSSKNSPMASPIADGSLRSSGDRHILQALDPDVECAQSPPSAVGSSGSDQQRAEAAAYARRERKIMDLEISNSSLLVINKSLEREIRRQKTELRRYKRLSRKSSVEAVRVSSGRLSLLTEDAEVEEEQSDSADEESEDPESETDSFADEPMSPGAITQRDVRHRKHDQLRLKKDLAKHKELLADSQCMNQSLKKCMNITESLIREGNKALEYRVNQDEIRLGGRVLSADDEFNGDFGSSMSLAPPETTDHLGDPSPVGSATDFITEHQATPGFTIFEDATSADARGIEEALESINKSLDERSKSMAASESWGDTF